MPAIIDFKTSTGKDFKLDVSSLVVLDFQRLTELNLFDISTKMYNLIENGEDCTGQGYTEALMYLGALSVCKAEPKKYKNIDAVLAEVLPIEMFEVGSAVVNKMLETHTKN